MITLLEFAQRVLDRYTVLPEGQGLCNATYGVALDTGRPADDEGTAFEYIIDAKVAEYAESVGRTAFGYYWPTEDNGSRIACMNHIIKELENESNQSPAQ